MPMWRVSPSSQRAWIEIASSRPHTRRDSVALLAEGVDRNLLAALSTRLTKVALLAEGVDRNHPARDSSAPSLVALLAEGVDRN